MKEQVEIVMATYNGEKYIKEQLDSLLSQSYPDLLVDVCDDGSTDGTVSIVKEYSKKYRDEKIEFYESKSHILREKIKEIDILFGAILISTFDTKPVVTEQMIESMK